VRPGAAVLALATALLAAGCGTGGIATGGDQSTGKKLFLDKCGGCHELADAGTSGGTGPNLDENLAGKDEAFIETSIVDPSARIAEGFSDGIMPPNFRDTLQPAELEALVKYLAEVTK
jgi:cytochrome c oxidase subunit 2